MFQIENKDNIMYEYVNNYHYEGDTTYLLLYQYEYLKKSGIDEIIGSLNYYISVINLIDNNKIQNQETIWRVGNCLIQWICENHSSFSHTTTTTKIKRSYAIYRLTTEQKIKIYNIILNCNILSDYDPKYSINNLLKITYDYIIDNLSEFINDINETFHEIILLNYSELLSGKFFENNPVLLVQFLTLIKILIDTHQIIFEIINYSKNIINSKINLWFTPTYKNLINDLQNIKENLLIYHKEFYLKTKLDDLFEINNRFYSSDVMIMNK